MEKIFFVRDYFVMMIFFLTKTSFDFISMK